MPQREEQIALAANVQPESRSRVIIRDLNPRGDPFGHRNPRLIFCQLFCQLPFRENW